jgi:hypothetical protein
MRVAGKEARLPDAKGKLSDQERAVVADFINRKATVEGDPCPVCGSFDTRVGSELAALHAAGSSTYMPAVPVVCHNCGFIRFFHSEGLGLSPRTPVEPESSAGEGD